MLLSLPGMLLSLPGTLLSLPGMLLSLVRTCMAMPSWGNLHVSQIIDSKILGDAACYGVKSRFISSLSHSIALATEFFLGNIVCSDIVACSFAQPDQCY
jgi:hypothetical protein